MVPHRVWLPSIPRTSTAAWQTRGQARTKSHTNIMVGQRLTVVGGYLLFSRGASFVPKVRPFHLLPVLCTPSVFLGGVCFFLSVDVWRRPAWVTLGVWTVGTSCASPNDAWKDTPLKWLTVIDCQLAFNCRRSQPLTFNGVTMRAGAIFLVA